jgi:uncharacterized membrane protein YgcG
MSGPQLEIVVALPFVLLGVALVAAFAWVPEAPPADRHPAARRSLGERIGALVQLVGAWFVLTTLTIWCVALVAFLVLHATLFSLGTGAASVGLFLTVVVLEITPFAWGVLIVHRARRNRVNRDGTGGQGGSTGPGSSPGSR